MTTNHPAPYRTTLTDVDRNLRVVEWSTSSTELDPESPFPWRVKKYVLHGGRQEGVDIVSVDNGLLHFTVIPTRGMNLWQACVGDLRLGWDSPVTEIVHPEYVNLESRGGLGWLEGFGEWICRCGLESNGAPGKDAVVNNVGETVEVHLTLHGKISNLPARRVEVLIDPPPRRRLRVCGVVDETMMFGPRLRLESEITTEPGSHILTIRDRVKNLSASPQEMELLYHANFGPPILEEGARFVAPLVRVSPRDARAAEGGMVDWERYRAPEPGFVEQAYFLRLAGDDDRQTETLLCDSKSQRGVSLRFSLDELPCFTLWKNTAARESGYVTGLEPATNYPNPRRVERAGGRVPVLAAGETYTSTLHVAALTTDEEVAASAARISKLAADTEPVIDETPPAGGP